jgi:hypothetical protein
MDHDFNAFLVVADGTAKADVRVLRKHQRLLKKGGD